MMTWTHKATLLLHLINIARAAIINNFQDVTKPRSPQDISCYKLRCFDTECRNYLPVIDDQFQPPSKTIYFIQSSCVGGLSSRVACSVESAAYANPDWHVTVMFTGPLKSDFRNSKTYTKLMSLRNIFFYRLNVNYILQGTLLEDIFFGLLQRSLYPAVHSSDFLRILVLRRYGGVYLDSDMIVMRSFNSLPNNFIVRESEDNMAAGIIAVGRDEIGRNFADVYIRGLSSGYNPTSWSGSSGFLYARTLNRICDTDRIDQMDGKQCQGFNVFHEDLFYPIHWEDWMLYYKAGVQVPIQNDTYTHHLWNSLGSQVELQRHSFLSQLAKRYCPKIFALYGNKFGQ